MLLKQEIEWISRTTACALRLIKEGQHSTALEMIKECKRSFCATESTSAITSVEALILLAENKKYKARKLICERNYAAWESTRLKEILRLCYPPCDSGTKLYHLRIKGGLASFGPFTQFSNQHYFDIEVIANSQSEALQYAVEFANFSAPEQIKVAVIKICSLPEDQANRGVLSCSPFSI